MELEELDSLLKDILADKPLPMKAEVAKPDVEVEAITASVTPEELSEPVEEAAVDAGVITEPTESPGYSVSNVFTDTDDRDRIRIPMPVFTPDDLADTMDIRNFATLVRLETRRWHAKVKDRQASRDVAAANDADAAAFETRKRLLAGADEKLKRIHKAIDSARAKHYELTLPWTTRSNDDLGRRTGPRLLPNTLFFEYTKEMATCKAEVKAAVDDFVPAYPSLIEQAKAKLGKRFDSTEYPLAETIKEHFGLDFDFSPIPQGDDFKGLPKQQLDALAGSINGKARKMMENAMQDVWTRLYKAMQHMFDRLSSPDKTFHYTMTDNVSELARLLPHLNVTNDARIDKIHKALIKHVTPHDAKDLRDKPVLRKQVAAAVSDILADMEKANG